MIVKIKMNIANEPITMMFGNSYKTWDDQFTEYFRLITRNRKQSLTVLDIETSNADWIGYGGLKWCAWESFQDCLNNEGKGREVNKLSFVPNSKVAKKANEIAREICTK